MVIRILKVRKEGVVQQISHSFSICKTIIKHTYLFSIRTLACLANQRDGFRVANSPHPNTVRTGVAV